MKTFLKIVVGVILLGGIALGAVLYFSAGKRDVARQFVTLSTSGDYEGASALMHEALKAEFPMSSFETGFAGVKPYVEVSFSGISIEGETTSLKGTATTADGCMSEIAFDMLGDKIVSFNIPPLCRQ